MQRVEYTEKRAIRIDDTGAEGHELFMRIKDALRLHRWTGHQNTDNFVFEFEDDEAFDAAKAAVEGETDNDIDALRLELRKLGSDDYADLREGYYNAACGMNELVEVLKGQGGQLAEVGAAARQIKAAMDNELGILGKVL